MSKKRVLIFVATVVLLAALNGVALARQDTNLLQNPGFEQPYSGGAAGGWQKWSMDTPKSDPDCLVAYHVLPKWNVETADGFVRDGAASQYVGNNWDTWGGGVYQTVPATPGTLYRFSFYGRGRGSSEASPAASEANLQMNVRAGIDPNGSGAWSDADVVWGAAGSPHDAWQQFTVEATATGNQITVFTSANWGITGVNQCRQFLDTWYDAAQLVAQTQPTDVPPTAPIATVPSAPTSAVPTEPAAATVEAALTAPAEPAASATPAGRSTICVNAFLDANGNGLRDDDEGYVAGVTLTIAQGNALIGQVSSTGRPEPLCFGDLMAGEYQAAQSLPPTLELTTQPNTTVTLAEGQTISMEFGSRLRATAEAEPTAEAAGQPTPTLAAVVVEETAGGPGWLVYLGLGAILVGIALLGVLLFTTLRR